ncbi:hypothetical protein A2W48_01175 [Candidatus Giovannonibacteria bacterium RIFCSPHIGHO2_12_44_12]|uniref:PpiC domain-containing protein n=5 Tax=Candidatus Giovannoniibacteriota TaxID=1752738 RepID=A0A1F5X300_9BACT|nr:MAG: hypothetical protein UW55_C0022G0008 [Candidatus Giovannonibacteria bacterium GW2011_GWA2_44_26]OGF73461.1 MAG: hypothetical protein A2W57_01150 [Candidatus Giovannonibacteria bacterium RIFCSPHIGHO2_02_43_16]OGF81941.1 MAG: hypothetical protein A2W48_01175 [Candidatus Giovannonibacteria bacterium RIFCSPHIGHO2_12_44_12]OGF85554.1 MAG: hypothetical protein A2Z63_02885 [Candidatus Giovannonibacteria bacterium RIFCSPLOWO2_02_44_8]OGF95653.1 MAG: hypothetical protein A2Y47_00085 [Candidatus 
MNKKLVVLIMGLIVLTALFLRIRSSLPVLRVEGENFHWEDFSKIKSGLARFRDLNKDNVSDLDIERGVLMSYVEDTLIKKELEKRGNGNDIVEKMVSGTISPEERGKIENATAQLYGWTIEDFEKIVLAPQARRTLLDEELQKENTDFETWLEKSQKEAKISIYLWRWKWSGTEVKERF